MLLVGIGIVLYTVLCTVYFVFTARPAALGLQISWKLALGTIIGAPIMGFGAILIPAIYFNAAVEPLPNYSKWRDILVAIVIAAIGTVVMFFTVLTLAWEVLG